MVDRGGYTCIEPDGWLTKTVLDASYEMGEVVREANSTMLLSLDVAAVLDIKQMEHSFDVIVVSQYLLHAPRHSLETLLYSCTKWLSTRGRLFAAVS